MQQYLGTPLWQLLMEVAQSAAQRGWQLYLVGGAVRDLLLAMAADPQTPTPLFDDIDLVVDGCYPGVQAREASELHEQKGAGVILAEDLRQRYPQARLQVHGRFQTSALLWHQDPVFDSLWVDIATARTEFYPYPAANPEVEASSLKQDLYRRDFTINALAVKLTSPQPGELLDFFGGWWDLQAKQVRVLHANSFIEDPTRIYRAVRFAVKLGFQIDPQTEGYIRYAIASGIYDRIHLEMGKAPALQTRLKAELKYILQAPYWQTALTLLAELGALRCIDPTLELDTTLWRQLRLLEQWLNSAKIPRKLDSFAPSVLPPVWQLRLEIIIAYGAAPHSARIAQNLQLPDESLERLKQLVQVENALLTALVEDRPASQIVDWLASHNLAMLLLIAVRNRGRVRQAIWCYLTRWSQISPSVDGNDLKTLGYKPGPQFKQILKKLRDADLDGKINDRAAALRFLAEHFPLSSCSPPSEG
jgi:tRNA nucleotidyltransferase (CCA-adding enzyme)